MFHLGILDNLVCSTFSDCYHPMMTYLGKSTLYHVQGVVHSDINISRRRHSGCCLPEITHLILLPLLCHHQAVNHLRISASWMALPDLRIQIIKSMGGISESEWLPKCLGCVPFSFLYLTYQFAKYKNKVSSPFCFTNL